MINWKIVALVVATLFLAAMMVTACKQDSSSLLDPGMDVVVNEVYEVSGGGEHPTKTEEPEPDDGTNGIPPIVATYEVKGQCENGKVVGIGVFVEITGGVEPYVTVPDLPYYAKPGQEFKVDISSATADGNPKATVYVKVPRRFDCQHAGGNGGGNGTNPTIPPTEKPAVCPTDKHGKENCDKPTK